MAVTPNYGWPVPVATDLVKDGYAAIADLGDAIDATVFGLPSGALTHINTTTFSTVASQSINDVFSATYDNYKIVLNCTGPGGFTNLIRFRVGGADNTTANYNWSQLARDSTSTTVGATRGSGVTAGELGNQYATANAQIIDVFNPFLADETLYSTMQTILSGCTQIFRLTGGALNLTTSFTGFTMFPSSSTITGTIRVYGVQN